jgi:hypothetical protein
MVDQRDVKRIDERPIKVSIKYFGGGVNRAVFVLKIAAEQLLVAQMELSFSTSISSVPSLHPSQV